MTASKLAPQAIAAQLLRDHPATALDILLDAVRIVSASRARSERKRQSFVSAVQAAAAAEIVAAVCRHFEIHEGLLRGRHRYKNIARPRHVAWALLRWRLGWTHLQIGEMFDRDQSTVMSGLARVREDDGDVRGCAALMDALLDAAE